MDDELDADLRAEAVAEFDHLLKLVSGIHMQQGERDGAGMKCLLRETDHHRGILADGVEHHGPFELGGDLAEDVNALGFQGSQMT